VITAAQKSTSGNFIWKMVEARRKTYPIRIIEVDGDQNRISVQIKENQKELGVGETVYLKLGSRDSAFKAEVLEQALLRTVLTFPEEVVMNENRADTRNYFHSADEKFVQIKKIKNQVSSLRDRVHNVMVCDISESGLSIFIPHSLDHYYDLRSRIALEMIGPYRLAKSIVGEVVFKMPIEIKGTLSTDVGFKLGIHLDIKIPKAILARFVLKKMFSITDEKIVQDEAFRRKVHTSIKVISKDLSEKKAFKKFFESLEIQRSDHQYLKQHIYLLCEVLTGLGSKLGWITHKTVDKLIYVAYLHDLRLMDHPRVARIPSKKEFDRVKSQLTEAERKAFLEAPAYADEMARQDSESYQDVIKMLIQQKELPDGTGFPQGITAAGLAPLSCLFILSHYFVDYVMNHSDWTTEDFVKTYKNQLKGQYFTKIFQVMN
jgi:HD-GYP domain-containing protein (c-di-GMP phosphodiesterase class II)